MSDLATYISTASISDPLSYSAYVIGDPAARERALDSIVETYQRFFKEKIAAARIQAACIELVKDATGCHESWHPIWARAERFKETGIYLPIFLDAGPHRDLGQMLFDSCRPGVLCLSDEEYLSTTNPSKRACFGAIRV